MAMRVWTEQELAALETRVQKGHASPDLYENVLAIILDSTIGGNRLHWEHAEPKAKAIVAVVARKKKEAADAEAAAQVPLKKSKSRKRGIGA